MQSALPVLWRIRTPEALEVPPGTFQLNNSLSSSIETKKALQCTGSLQALYRLSKKPCIALRVLRSTREAGSKPFEITRCSEVNSDRASNIGSEGLRWFPGPLSLSLVLFGRGVGFLEVSRHRAFGELLGGDAERVLLRVQILPCAKLSAAQAWNYNIHKIPRF